MRSAVQSTPWIQYAVAMTPIAGEPESGDRYIVVPRSRGPLLAVADGLGHGVEAARAAKLAVETVQGNSGDDLVALFQECDRRMQFTRGAAMILAAIDGTQSTMTWISVGNVDGMLLRSSKEQNEADEAVLMRSGVVGLRLPNLQPAVISIAAGDTLILATDGIRSDFAAHVSRREHPQRIADNICAKHSKRSDDALVLVARYIGVP